MQIERKLAKQTGGTAFVNANNMFLTNNEPMSLFDNIKYELGGQEIESIYQRGYATTILGLTKYSSSFNVGLDLNECWALDTTLQTADTSVGFKRLHDHIL